MTLKEYLSQATILDKAINSMLEQLEQYKNTVSVSRSLVCAVKSGVPDGSVTERIVEKIAAEEEKINNTIDAYVDTKASIRRLLSHIDNIEHRTVMELHYLNGHTWEDVAEMSYISIRNVHNMHNAALKVLAEYFSDMVA